jgi:hypothetical protein
MYKKLAHNHNRLSKKIKTLLSVFHDAYNTTQQDKQTPNPSS